MLRKITSDWIHDGKEGFVRDHCILVDESGVVAGFRKLDENERRECVYYPGMLVPGFINAHCHLELSHLRGKFESGTGLISFLKSVVAYRETELDEVLRAISDADSEMQRQGIVAVGDISNKADTLETKRRSPIHYHTFVEAFDFLQEGLADNMFEQYRTVYDEFEGMPRSLVPHAPYSVSKRLFGMIRDFGAGTSGIQSIHNQESPDEDQLFLTGGGAYRRFWESFGFSMESFKAFGNDAVAYVTGQMGPGQRLLCIHNTCMDGDQIERMMAWNPEVRFVSCPNANLFIENRLPDYRTFVDRNARIALGTDSLSSNWRLSILSEMQTVLRYNSWLPLEEVLKWACHHGAVALKLENKLGSFEQGKRPGVNWIRDVGMDKGSLHLGPRAQVVPVS